MRAQIYQEERMGKERCLEEGGYALSKPIKIDTFDCSLALIGGPVGYVGSPYRVRAVATQVAQLLSSLYHDLTIIPIIPEEEKKAD